MFSLACLVQARLLRYDTTQALTWRMSCLCVCVCVCVHEHLCVCVCVWLNFIRFERWSHRDGSCPRIPTVRCCLPPAAHPGSPHTEVKINPSRQPRLPVWRWWSAHLSAPRTPSACPSLLSITFGVAVLMVLRSSFKKKRPCLLKDQNGQKAGESLPLYTTPFRHVSLSPSPPWLGCNV